jgi:hypothetical protein
MIRQEERRLRTTFERLFLIALATPAAGHACAGAQSTTPPAPEAGASAQDAAGAPTVQDAVAPEDVQDASAGAITDAPAEARGCALGQPYFDDASYTPLPDAGPDAPEYPCYYFVDVPCGTNFPTVSGAMACSRYVTECASICSMPGGFFDCLYSEGAGCLDGSLTAETGVPATIACGVCPGVGRRPRGLLASRIGRTQDPLGAYFARVAHLERASVVAFERLRDELRAHGAPSELVRAAERGIGDEQRHARAMSRIALRHGGRAPIPRVRRGGIRSLEAMAMENAREGCVRETFGAMVATWQARHAQNAGVRACMTKIARDETRHAALAWAVARWVEIQLSPRARSRVTSARRAEASRLVRNAATALPRAALLSAGLPSAEQAQALVAGMAELWR